MRAVKHRADQMTPLERAEAIAAGRDYDRVPCVPFMGELKCSLARITVWDFWHDPQKMADAEVIAFNRYGYDRITIGPNTRGITEALGGRFVYPEKGLPYADAPFLKSYDQLDDIDPIDAKKNPRIQTFAKEADILQKEAADIVPIEASIGGPFTIASNLRGVELLLRDCRKCSEQIERLMRIITDSQKSCIDVAAEYGMGIAMADPVANPALIGPRMYEKFIYPYTKELTDYALKKTGRKVSLHMCGSTYSIWKYLRQYELNELSLDNIIDLEKAVEELGEYIPIAGNVDPVEIVMNGSKKEI
ncbi:MAG: MtaA/CmuA family methyltransferase, partial [Lachnospiraceae bacterium]|nr:MtaA/CmuA family methyltransferase [Lachnospiraceae bacterium]